MQSDGKRIDLVPSGFLSQNSRALQVLDFEFEQ